MLTGQVLDAGCGTGEQTLLAASSGAEALGVDVSPLAVEQARAKAAARGISARFEVADALSLEDLGLDFDTIIDSGLFHVFDDESRVRYIASLASVLRPGGRLYLMCFSDRQPGAFGPRRVGRDELRAAFGDGWTIIAIQADTFDDQSRRLRHLDRGGLAGHHQPGRPIDPAPALTRGSTRTCGVRRLPGHMPRRPNNATRAGTSRERTAIASRITRPPS